MIFRFDEVFRPALHFDLGHYLWHIGTFLTGSAAQVGSALEEKGMRRGGYGWTERDEAKTEGGNR